MSVPWTNFHVKGRSTADMIARSNSSTKPGTKSGKLILVKFDGFQIFDFGFW
jgi:hypothetical protein